MNLLKERRPHRRRISMDIPTEVHRKIKQLSAHHNCTMTVFLMRLIMDKIKQEEGYGN